jgi:RNA-directed DNA polymerase
LVKRYNNLWDKVISDENLELAYQRAKKGKSQYNAVARFDENKEKNLQNIKELLITHKFNTAKYLQKTIYEPKERIIYVLPFYPDRIVQHALMNVLIPILTKMFIKNTFACIKDRGLHKGSILTSQYVKKYKYCLKCDIRKFYPSINHDILYKMLERKFKDKDVLWLLHNIIYSFEGETNVPIGNLTSQWFGNLYMNELDKYVLEKLKVSAYLRYCDDFCLFSNDKAELNRAKDLIEKYLTDELKLVMSKCDLFQTSRGVDFLGYRHFKNYILLRKRTATRVKKRLPALVRKFKNEELSQDRFRSCIESTLGWIKWADTHNFQLKTKLLELKEMAYSQEK